MGNLLEKFRHMTKVRHKRTVVALVVAFSIFLVLNSLRSGTSTYLHQKNDVSKDIQSERTNVQNPGYRKIGLPEATTGEKCALYFNNLVQSNTPGINLQQVQAISINPLVYRKDKWFKKYRRDLKMKLKRQKLQYTPSHELEGERIYKEESQKVIDHEKQLVLDFNLMRVYGGCLAANSVEQVKNIQKLEMELFPWLSRKCPKFENMKGEVLENGRTPSNVDLTSFNGDSSRSFIQYWKKTSKGKGIVIPITRHGDKTQVNHIKRLLKTFRALNNSLPVQILHINEDVETKESISQVAMEYKQDVWFVDMLPVMTELLLESKDAVATSPNFALGLSTIFHSFQEAVVLSYQAIPLIEDFAKVLLESESYSLHGVTFFKKPSHFMDKKTKFPNGFFEVTNFIKSQLMPSGHDSQVFGLFQRSEETSSTGRVLEDNFQHFIDPNMMVLNKEKVLSGLLIGCNLQFYKLFNVRFDEEWPITQPEFLWLGQEIAGTNVKVNFNAFHGTGLGVLTPPEKKPSKVVTTSDELCSSSWGQVDERDAFTLLYITSHQAENWRTSKKFQLDLQEKFGIPKTREIENNMDGSGNGNTNEKLTITETDYEVFTNTFQANALTVNDVMIPPTVDNNAGEKDSVEPNFGWLQQRDFGGAQHIYWCCYNVVGKAGLGKEGMIIKYGDLDKERINRITSVWMEDI